MASKDLYEDLIKFYEFMLGRLPNREGFKAAVESTIHQEDLRVFFLLPFLGQLTLPKLEKKALRAGISPDALQTAIRRLIPEGLITTYHKDGEQVYERGSILTMTELQIRKMEAAGEADAAIRLEAARFMDLMIEGGAAKIPTKTPYYRVLPVEQTLTGKTPTGEVVVNVEVPDPRTILPIDLVSEMIKKQPLMAVADCYCRKAKQILDKACDHPLETCFYFNELAELQLNAGRARKVTYEEAMVILKNCADLGLVHNVNNAQGHIHSLCNCCTCSCGVMKSIQRGETNAGTASRYVASYLPVECTQCGVCADFCPVDALTFDGVQLTLNDEKCIGCGLCVAHCPQGALQMIPRARMPKIPASVGDMFGRINREAILGLVAQKLGINP